MSLRDLRRHAGRFVIAGFSGHSVPDDLRRLVGEFDLGGVIYFARNVVEPGQVAELSREASALKRDWPLWISVDQEGGRVARLKTPFTIWPPAITLGRAGDAKLAARYGAALAEELKAVGINLDWAPVLDVNSNPANPVIGDRALSSDADVVGTLGVEVIKALQEAGVAACGKHFPGHGDTDVDSHHALPVVEHERRRLESLEFIPFRKAIDAGVAAIMTAHVMVPAIDRDRVATFSPKVVTDVLKGTLGFRGLVATDDLGMKAVSATTPLPDASVAALRAGCDVLLYCNHTAAEQWTAIEAIIRAGESGEIAQTRIDDAWARQKAVKERFFGGRPASPAGLDRIGCAEHLTVAREMAAWA